MKTQIQLNEKRLLDAQNKTIVVLTALEFIWFVFTIVFSIAVFINFNALSLFYAHPFIISTFYWRVGCEKKIAWRYSSVPYSFDALFLARYFFDAQGNYIFNVKKPPEVLKSFSLKIFTHFCLQTTNGKTL